MLTPQSINNRQLAGFVFTSTGLDAQARTLLERRVEALGATYSRSLTMSVTHLLAANVFGSEKYRVALKYGLPVLDCRVIDEVEKGMGFQEVLSRFLAKVLHGVKISLSPCEEVEQLTELGAVVHSSLVPETDILVAEYPSSKVYYARIWNIPVVSIDWTRACIQSQSLVSLDHYKTEFMVSDRVLCETKSKIFKGLKFYLTKDDTELKDRCVKAGAILSGTLDSGVTHLIAVDNFIHADIMNSMCSIVGSDWISRCLEENALLNVKDYLLVQPTATTRQALSGGIFAVRKSKKTPPLEGRLFHPSSFGVSVLLSLGASKSDTGHFVSDDFFDRQKGCLSPFWLEEVKRLKKWVEPDSCWYYRTIGDSELDLKNLNVYIESKANTEVKALQLLVEHCNGVISKQKDAQLSLSSAVETERFLEAYHGVTTEESDRKKISLDLNSDFVAPPICFDSQTQVCGGAILAGCVICISHRLWYRRQELCELCVGMGALFEWSYKATCTHYLHAGSQEDSFEELKMVKLSGKFVVHPDWLISCKSKIARLSEKNFPPHQTSQKLLFILSGYSNKDRARLGKHIESMGASVTEIKDGWNSGITHLVCESPWVRSEKFFCAMAAGIEVVNGRYIEKCAALKQWKPFIPVCTSNEATHVQLFKAHQHWRLQFLQTGKRFFEDKRIRYEGPKDSQFETLERIIQAGGGTLSDQLADLTIARERRNALDLCLSDITQMFLEK